MARKLRVLPENPSFLDTETGNAERFVHQHGCDMRFCHPWDKWLVWDGMRWTFDDAGIVTRRGKDTIRSMYAEAAATEDDHERRRLANWARKSDTRTGIANMAYLARSEPTVPILPADIDAQPWLLNCQNGTVDLRTGWLREHKREDCLTKALEVAYDPNATCPTWDAFLERILPDPALRVYLQRAVGYSLTGSTREQVYFLCYGLGSNGKSTFLDTIHLLLGDYGQQADFSTFLIQDRNAVRNDLAQLRGARFVSAVEADGERRLAEVLVKTLTGGDRITTRFLYSEFFTFKPEFKIWLAANHKPVIRGTDYAIWRRTRLIPFTVTIPVEEQDHSLAARLRLEVAGILAWAVRGCLEWQREGLGYPTAIVQATEEYRREMDELGDFITERCEVGPLCEATSSELYQAYLEWCSAAGDKPLPSQVFGRKLTERGFLRTRTNRDRRWVGLSIRGSRLLTGDTGDTSDTESQESHAREGNNQSFRKPVSPVSPVSPEDICLLHKRRLDEHGHCPECGW